MPYSVITGWSGGDVTGMGDLTGVYNITTGWRRSERFQGRVGQMPYSVMTGQSREDVTGRENVTGMYNAEGLAEEEVNASREGWVKCYTV